MSTAPCIATAATATVEIFEVFGLKLNNKKTEALWIGTYVGCTETFCPEKDLKWVKSKVKALGVWLATDPTETMNANYGEKLLKIQNTPSCWEKRRLSLLGKIAVLKSLVASQLVYILLPLPTNQQVVKAINKLFYNFPWNGKGDEIKRDVII